MAHDFYDEDALVFTDVKLKITGDIIEFSKFGRSFPIGVRPYANVRKTKPSQTQEELDSEESLKPTKEEVRRKSLARARKKIGDLINTNAFAYKDDLGRVFHPVFLTLTYKENFVNLKTSNKHFQSFTRQLSYLVYKNQNSLKYLAVIEFQGRGAVHYHIVLFNFPFVHFSFINNLWVHGSTDIHTVRSVKNMGRYVSAYLGKDLSDSRLVGRKSYLTSKGLLKPTNIYHEELINLFLLDIPKESLQFTKHIPQIKYLRTMDSKFYNLKDFPEVREKLLKDYAGYFEP